MGAADEDADVAGEVASAAAALPGNLVFVDLETTGGSAARDRIIEVGLIRFENGVEVEQWSALVDPEMPIPSNIQSFTGISNEMVRSAPVFAQIAREVAKKLEGAVFVAHNARFDHSFLRREFLRLGMPFAASVLCTVKLSRRLYPQYARHNLDVVMERHDIVCEARHRALGDALVLRDLWLKLQSRWSPEALAQAASRSMLENVRLPAQLPQELADELPEGPGIYRFFGADDVLLFVGRSKSLRTRILAQLGESAPGSRDASLAAEVCRVEWTRTAGELGAMLREARLIRASRPRHGHRALGLEVAATLRLRPDGGGRIDIVALNALDGSEVPGCFGIFRSGNDARKALLAVARSRDLCLKVLGLEESEGSCLSRQVDKCRGACVGKEAPLVHEMRVRMALSSLKVKSWPFAGRIALRERWGDVTEYHVLDNWAYLGSARSDEELAMYRGHEHVAVDRFTGGKAATAQATGDAYFDAEVYRILVRYFSNHDRFDWRELQSSAAMA